MRQHPSVYFHDATIYIAIYLKYTGWIWEMAMCSGAIQLDIYFYIGLTLAHNGCAHMLSQINRRVFVEAKSRILSLAHVARFFSVLF